MLCCENWVLDRASDESPNILRSIKNTCEFDLQAAELLPCQDTHVRRAGIPELISDTG